MLAKPISLALMLAGHVCVSDYTQMFETWWVCTVSYTSYETSELLRPRKLSDWCFETSKCNRYYPGFWRLCYLQAHFPFEMAEFCWLNNADCNQLPSTGHQLYPAVDTIVIPGNNACWTTQAIAALISLRTRYMLATSPKLSGKTKPSMKTSKVHVAWNAQRAFDDPNIQVTVQ